MSLPRLVGLFFAHWVVAVGLVNGQTDEARAKEEAKDLVRKSIGADASLLLRATRREDWEDTLFHLQRKIKGRIAKAAYFFEVTENGYFVLSPEESVHVVTVDGERFWIVAVPTSPGPAYGLFGFPDCEVAFRRLVTEARLVVRSVADAEADALLWFTTVKDPRQHSLIFRPKDLRRKVEDYYEARLPAFKAEKQVTLWWRGFLAAKLGNRLGIKSNGIEGGYEVTITHVRSKSNRIELVFSKLRVSQAGVADKIGTSPLYR